MVKTSQVAKRKVKKTVTKAWYESYAGGKADYYQRYMDKEWGVPIFGRGRSRDNKLFEMLTLEGAQAGLSWDTILRKRQAYREAFDNFDIAKVAAYSPKKVNALLKSPGEGSAVIVKNRAKIASTLHNAKLCQAAAEEHGSFCKFLWSFVGGRPKVNRWKNAKSIPVVTPEAQLMSRELKKRGFGFVGPTICYALMQSVGMVNDHPVTTPQWRRVNDLVKRQIQVLGISGEALLEVALPIHAREILKQLNGSCFDRLLRGPVTVEGEINEGEALTYVKVDMGVLSGLAEEMVDVLMDFGAIQDSPPGFNKQRCLSVAKSDGTHFCGGGFGGEEQIHHVMLLPDGRILAKYHSSSDYMERSGSYSGSWHWQIAEGSFRPDPAEPGVLEVQWTGWAELVHRSTEAFGPGSITGKWEAKLIDEERKRGPSVLVPTSMGRLSVPELCQKWAKEGEGGLACARTKSVRLKKSEIMPNLSEEALKACGMEPAHLPFWCPDSASTTAKSHLLE
ncbi:unnamed protein product [Effrenium voratum]|uniref:DNA-3-methyladenine glycosylase I n=1 Tax=Effrenium voratum TaxID=2562239 RepID=A0AA36J5Y8_9DINO|nr:unnamed protein product [Effrenium voratum]